MMRIFLAIALVLPMVINAQTWVEIYNGAANYDDHAYALTVDASNNVYVTGSACEVTHSQKAFTTVSYDVDGDQRWVQVFGSQALNPTAIGEAITVCNSFYYVYATGWVKYETSGLDFFTVKFHPDGDTLWTRQYNGPHSGSDKAYAIGVDGSGNIYVTGYSADSLGNHIATIKYNSDGTQLWASRYDAFDVKDLAVDVTGNVYITGYIREVTTHDDIITIKYNPAGDTVWTRVYNSPGDKWDVPEAIALDDDNNVYIGGKTSVEIVSIVNCIVVKYDSLGNLQWASEYDSPLSGDDHITDIQAGRLGDVYVTGYSDGFDTYDDILTIRYDADGDTVWVQHYDGPNNHNDAGTCIVVERPFIGENIYVGGYSMGVGTSHDFTILKYAWLGAQQWVARYDGDGSGGDGISDISLDFNGDILVTGHSLGFSPTHTNYCTAKYPPTDPGVSEDKDHGSSLEEYLIEVSPNPFKDRVDFTYNIGQIIFEKTNDLELKIYNVTGKLIKTFSLSTAYSLLPTSISWHGEDNFGKKVPSGIYFLKFTASSLGNVGNYTTTEKLLLIR